MIDWQIFDDHESLSETAASILLESVATMPSIRLGLPTGTTPVRMYGKVVEMSRSRGIRFDRVITFNLDEYVGIPRHHSGSYFTYMKDRLFDPISIPSDHAHVPCGDPHRLKEIHGTSLEGALNRECERYESAITDHGGIDLMFLGLGSNSHIAFNEPGTPFDSRTHVVKLKPSTIAANARFFPEGDVPDRAITMGIGTILSARKIVLLASGERKRDAIRALRSGETSPEIPASALHLHNNVLVLCDRTAEGLS